MADAKELSAQRPGEWAEGQQSTQPEPNLPRQSFKHSVKKAVMAPARRVRDRISRMGLDIRTVRGRDHWRAGIEIVWHRLDYRTERSMICHVDSFGVPVLFLVRNPNDHIQSCFVAGHFYAEDELRVIQQYYDGGTFLDVGANVGNHSLFAATALGATRVLAVEPFPPAYQLLRCNIALNALEQRIVHHPVALADHDGVCSISARHGNLGLAIVKEAEGDIPLVVGDSLFANEQIGFLKVDVEGLEMAVLRGLEQTIARCRPPAMVEVAKENIPAFEQFCQRLNYRAVWQMAPYPENTYFMVVPD